MEIQPGAVITPDIPTGCNKFYVCIYSNAQDLLHGGGWYLSFTTCGHEWNLGKIPFPDGGTWSDKASALYNNQSSGTTSYFYNYSGSGNVWNLVTSPASGHYLSNLADNGINDIIDGVHVCGRVPSPWIPNCGSTCTALADPAATKSPDAITSR